MNRLPPMTPAREHRTLEQLSGAGQLDDFQRIAFAASPVEVRLFDGRRLRGQERFPQVDADATGVP